MSRCFASGGQNIGVSASASVLPVNIQLISFRIDWFDLLTVQGTLKSLLQYHSSKASISLILTIPGPLHSCNLDLKAFLVEAKLHRSIVLH